MRLANLFRDLCQSAPTRPPISHHEVQARCSPRNGAHAWPGAGPPHADGTECCAVAFQIWPTHASLGRGRPKLGPRLDGPRSKPTLHRNRPKCLARIRHTHTQLTEPDPKLADIGPCVFPTVCQRAVANFGPMFDESGPNHGRLRRQAGLTHVRAQMLLRSAEICRHRPKES